MLSPKTPEAHTEFSSMGIAALYDIHANLPVPEAVLQEVREVKADRIVVGGDVLPVRFRRRYGFCGR